MRAPRRSPAPSDHDLERPTWKLEILRAVIAKKLKVQLPLAHLWRTAKHTGTRWRRPLPIVACPWRARRRQRRIAELRGLAASARDENVVIYTNEVDIHLSPKIGPGWVLPGG